MVDRRKFLKMGLAFGAAVTLSGRQKELIHALAFTAWPKQTLLPGKNIPVFVDPLPDLLTFAAPAPAGDDGAIAPIELQMREFKQNVLPKNFVLPGKPGKPYTGTWVWGYRKPDQSDADPNAYSYLGPVIVATRGTPTEIKYVNQLGTGASTNVLAYKYSVDQTLHWAAPTGVMMDMDMPMGLPSGEFALTYQGPIPAVPHLHGGEVPALLDGGPDAWFTSDGQYHGKAFYSKDGSQSNYCIYRYPNQQEAGLYWFHDHTLGATRVNVFCGLAGGYLLVDPNQQLPANLDKMPLVPLVIQDRSFDTNGQFLLPAGPPNNPNPEHPYWVPEFVGDTIVVNGKTWPYLNVEPRRYRFLVINGSNARTYEMFLTSNANKAVGPVIWQIGSEGGYLDTAVKIDPNAPKGQLSRLVMMPGERADIIIDFSQFAGQTLVIKNTGKAPYPGGLAPDGNTTGRIMQFRVAATGQADISYNPAVTPTVRAQKIVRLSSPTLIRQLTLNEVMGMPQTVIDPVTGVLTAFPGGPLEILVNNTKWTGKAPMEEARPDFTKDKLAYLSELPQEGTTEQWEIVNLTADAHPIHLHLVQFQAVNRQNFDVPKYSAAYGLAFPGSMAIDPMTMLPYAPGVYVPSFGPPLDYSLPGNGKVGGNPDVTPFLSKSGLLPPAANETGWKDTIQCPPGMVTRFIVRFAPTDAPAGSTTAYPFDPGNEDGADYVWHCHIVDHEDNEMMRPYTVKPIQEAPRSYVKGEDF